MVQPLVSVVIPVFNEAKTLEEIIRRVVAVDFPKELIVVDDASTDGSRDVLERLERDGVAALRGQGASPTTLKLLFSSANQGKGASLRRGFSEASGDIIVIQDADLEYDPKDIPRLILPIQQGVA